jgi:hypothetical protein
MLEGLGKPRTRFGRWMDKNGVKQGELPVSKNTATRLCNDQNYSPYEETVLTIISYLRGRGFDVRASDFW